MSESLDVQQLVQKYIKESKIVGMICAGMTEPFLHPTVL
jgi:hypothetical protein